MWRGIGRMAGAVEIFDRSDCFGGMSVQSRQALAEVCLRRKLSKRQYLFFEGQRAAAVYVLESGAIQLLKASPSGKEIVVRTVEPGEMFAEAILFEHETYPVSAVAVVRSELLELPRTEVHRLLDDRNFRNELLSILMSRVRYLTGRILDLTTCEVDERFFRFLAEHYGKKEHYAVALSKKDIAAAIGATPESLSRLILRLKKERKAVWKGRDLRLKPGFWKKGTP